MLEWYEPEVMVSHLAMPGQDVYLFIPITITNPRSGYRRVDALAGVYSCCDQPCRLLLLVKEIRDEDPIS